jgi:hypothetical protein
MSRSIRIRTKPNDGDKYVKVKLDHSFDFLEILSLKLTQAEVYRKFAADYGVIVGRVIANGGFGVPNAKVSVFIPLDSNEANPLIRELYPYQTTNDINSDGVRYNLLEDLPQKPCHIPVGTFPNKRKMLDNDVWLEIYDKYYKFTTSTNSAGDFMIFGVPTGTQNLHMDVDLSNMDFVSLKPYDLIEQGYTENLFESKTTFKSGTDLGSLVQVQSKDYSVNVLPFWGDLNENEVGVNRVDFTLNTEIIPNATFFGSIFTDSKKSSVRRKCQPRKTLGRNCDLATGTGKIEMIRRVSETSNEVEFMEIESKQIDENGNWSFTVPMNLNRFVTDEVGNLIPSEDPNVGIATTTKVRFRMSLNEFRDGLKRRNAHYLIPNMYNNYQFGSDTEDFDFFEMRWKKVYTVTNYIPRYQKAQGSATFLHTGIKDIGECENTQSFPFNRLTAQVTPFFTFLCIFISLYAFIINIINRILQFVLFNIMFKFMCKIKHWRNPRKRGACRCQACINLNGWFDDTPPVPKIPPSWNSSCQPCIQCAICYEGGDDDSADTSFSFKPQPIATLNRPIITITNAGSGLSNGNHIVNSSNFLSVTPALAVTYNTYSFELVVSGGVLTKVLLINQRGLGTSPAFYGTTYTLELDNTTLPLVIPSGTVQFTLQPQEIIILQDENDSILGPYTIDDTDYTYTGGGVGVIFQTQINADGQLDYIDILTGEEGEAYTSYIDTFPLLETFLLPSSMIGGTDKLIAFSISAFQTVQTVDGYTFDCNGFDVSICKDECESCPVTIVKLSCNDFEYDDVFDWANCVKDNLAETLGVIKYHFYNDWVIGSLYSVLFDYKARFKKKGKSFERFCDYDCRAPNISPPNPNDPNYKHRGNRCYDAYIAESFIFNQTGYSCTNLNAIFNKWEVLEIDDPNNDPNGRGLFVEYDNFLYYAARHDIEINSVNNGNLIANRLTSAADKKYLLFATNLIELGSMVTCDINGEPFVVNNMESTSYQKDDGVRVLYDVFDCFNACPINRTGTQLMSQAGIDIAFAQIADTPNLIGDDGTAYVLIGNDTDIPDYDGNNAIIIFDREDIVLRRLLCENFDYYNVPRTYSSSEVPTDYPLAPPPAYLEEVSTDTPPPPALPVNDILEFTIDSCAGLDDAELPSERMPPYYMYFGIRQGQSSLDKLRKNYFDRCVD